ncbi:MAG TPA: DUF202 domain-containing protein [Vicinamibacterales bacterium]|nr:DUF202 domain-containing protein [Vicinamibacterales bacterium]
MDPLSEGAGGGGRSRSGPPPDPRVILAADRTLLAWIRTALGLIGFGFLVARSSVLLGAPARAGQEAAAHTVLGVGLIALGTIVSVGAGFWHQRFVRRYQDEGTALRPVTPVTVILSVVLGAAGVGLAWVVLSS